MDSDGVPWQGARVPFRDQEVRVDKTNKKGAGSNRDLAPFFCRAALSIEFRVSLENIAEVNLDPIEA